MERLLDVCNGGERRGELSFIVVLSGNTKHFSIFFLYSRQHYCRDQVPFSLPGGSSRGGRFSQERLE